MTLYATGQIPYGDFGTSNDNMMATDVNDVADHPVNDLPMPRPKVKKRK